MKRFLEQSFYDLLEVSPSAPPEEIARAHERARSLYGPGSLAAYTLLSPEVASLLARRIEEAGTVLLEGVGVGPGDQRRGQDVAAPGGDQRGVVEDHVQGLGRVVHRDGRRSAPRRRSSSAFAASASAGVGS